MAKTWFFEVPKARADEKSTYYPKSPEGKSMWNKRAERFKNLVVIREGRAWRKKPGAAPIASGPIDSAFNAPPKK